LGLLLLAFPADTFAIPGQKSRSPCKTRYPSDSRVEWDCVRLRKGESPEKRFGDRWKDVLRFNRIDRRHAYPGVSLKVPRRLEEVADFTPLSAEYPGGDNDAKTILIDLREQFLGAYERGKLVFSGPITSGEKGNETPEGDFRVTAYHSTHRSTEYDMEGTDIPYPMTWALRFYIDREGVTYWIHGRDIPGHPASHGCVGLYDEAMQRKYYGVPRAPEMEDARSLFEWVIAPLRDDGKFHLLTDGPRVRIVGGEPGD
jgi:hypothetical protein